MRIGLVSPTAEFRRRAGEMLSSDGRVVVWTAPSVGGIGLARTDTDVVVFNAIDGEDVAMAVDRLPAATAIVLAACRVDDVAVFYDRGAGFAYLFDEYGSGRLPVAVEAAAAGLMCLDAPDLAPQPRAGASPSALSLREQDVLAELAAGSSNRRISEALGISENTVKFHLASIYRKLDVTGRAEAVYAGVRHGLLPT